MTRQREQLLILLDNYEQVKKVQDGMASSTGAAKAKFDEFYSNSTEARINDVKQSLESLFMTVIKSDTINGALVGIKDFINTLEVMSSTAKSAGIALIGFGTAFILLVKNWTGAIAIIKNTIAFFQLLPAVLSGTATATTLLSATFTKLTGVLTTLFMTPAGLIFTALATAIGIATYALTSHIKHQKELKESTESLTNSYNSLTDAMSKNNVEQLKSSSGDLKKQEEVMSSLLEKRKKLQTEFDKQADISSPSSGNKMLSLSTEIEKVNKQIEEQKKVMSDAGVTYDENTGKIKELEFAESRLATNDLIDKINAEREAVEKHSNEIISLIQEYQQLEEIENRSSVQKQRMSQISNILSNEIKGLIVSKDAEGNVTIQNTDLLSKEIDMRNAEISTAKTNANVKLETAKNNAQAQIGETTVTYKEVMKRISFYEAEMKALDNLADSQGNTMDALIAKQKSGTISSQEQTMLDNMARWAVAEGSRASSNLSALQKAKAQIDAIFNSGSGANFGSGGGVKSGTGYKPDGSGGSSGSSSSAKEIADIELKTDRYYNLKDAIDKINDALELNRTLQESETGERRVQLMKEEQKLLERKLSSINEINKEQKREKAEIESTLSKNGFSTNNGEITNLNERLKALQNYANSKSGDAKENAIENLKNLEELTKRYIDLVNNELPDSNKEWHEVSNTLKDINKQMVDIATEAQEKVTEMIKKQKEERIKAIEDEYNAKKDAVEKEKNLYNKQNAEDDYKSELAKEQQKLMEIQESIDRMSRDTTDQGKAKLDALMQEYKAQQERIDEMIKNNQRDRINEQFDEEQRRLEEEAQKKKDELDKKYDDKSIADIALQAIINGFYQFEGQVYNTQNAISNFMTETGESLMLNGKLLQEELINKLKEASEIIKNLGSMNISINMSNGRLPSYDVGTTYVPQDQVALVHKGEAILSSSLNPFNANSKFTDILRQQLLKVLPKIPTPVFEGRNKDTSMQFNEPFIVIQGNVDSEMLPQLEGLVDRKINLLKREMAEISQRY